VPSLEAQHGGPSKSVRALCAALARNGQDVELLTTDPASPVEGRVEVEGRLRLAAYRRDWPQRICPSSGLRRALGEHRPAVVHHHSIWLRTLHYAHRHATAQRIPLVISPRGMMSTWAWRHRGWRKRISRTLIHPGALEAAAGWHATSPEEESEIRALGFNQPVCVAPNGVTAPSAPDRESAAACWRELCPAVSTHRVALFYSRFHRKKRVLELIELWRQLAPADWLLLLVGIPQEYAPEMLQALAPQAPGAAPVAVFSGEGRPPPYAVASLFLLPSHNENFGLVIAEAMAHGVPVVVTDTTPWRALNAAGHGWCVPWEQFGDAVGRALGESAGQLAQRGRAARDWVLGEYSWDKSAAKLTAFYQALRSPTMA